MNMKKGKRIISAIILLCMIIGNITPIFATQVGEFKDIVNLGECGNHVKYNKDGKDIIINNYLVGFYENAIFHPAYCVNYGYPGVDNDREYGVTVEDISSLANNQAIWRVLINGYPYKTPQEMGFGGDEYSAYLATKQAVFAVIDGRDVNNYHGMDDVGDYIVMKIKELVDIGRNGTQTYKDAVISISKVSEASVDNKNSQYISQVYSLGSEVDVSDINIVLNTHSAPEGTFIADENNNAKTTFKKGEKFKVLVPKNNITGAINIEISAQGNCKTYPILYGKAPNTDLQNYVLTTDPYILATTRANFEYVPDGEIIINKIASADSELTGIKKGQGIANVKFRVESVDGQYNEVHTTNSEGKIYLDNMPLKKYIVTELETPDYFLIGEEGARHETELTKDGQSITLKIENTPVKLLTNVEKEADKVEAQGKEVITYEIDGIKNLSNVDLSNFKMTDKLPKEVRVQSIETGTYNRDLTYNITYNTNKRTNLTLKTNLNTKTNTVIDCSKLELGDDEYITSFSFNYGTAKVGFSNIKAVKVKTKVVEGLKNNSTFTNNVLVNGSYLEKTVKDEDDKITKVYENVLNVKKISSKDSEILGWKKGAAIPNTVFEIQNADGTYVATVKTDDKGSFTYKYLETGKNYQLKEISTNPYFLVNGKVHKFKFDKNGQTINLTVENEPVQIETSIEKNANKIEAQGNEIVSYELSDIKNKSNVELSDFTITDKLPKEVRIQSIETGTYNQDLKYSVIYNTNKRQNVEMAKNLSTKTNNKLDFSKLKLEDGEYVISFSLNMGKVKIGFANTNNIKVAVKVIEGLQDKTTFINKAEVSGRYLEKTTKDEDEEKTKVYENILKVLKVSSNESKLLDWKKGSPIADTIFEILDEKGNYITTIKTREDGTIEYKYLETGKTYQLKEVSTNPYFLVNGKVHKFKFDKNGQIINLTVENEPVRIENNIEKDADKKEAQGNEIVSYELSDIKNKSNVELSDFTITDKLPKEVRIQSIETGTYNQDLKYSVTYNTNKRQDVELAKELSTKTNNKLDFTNLKLEDKEYITSFSLNMGKVKIGFANKDNVKVSVKVIEGLQDKSTFINTAEVYGRYLEKPVKDEDKETTKVYENILKVLKVSKEYNQYLDKEARTPVEATFEILDENKEYITTTKTDKNGTIEYKYLETGKQYYLKEIATQNYYVINEELVPFKFEKNGQIIELTVENDNVNLLIDVQKDGPAEAEKGEIIDYTFNHIGNFSNTDVTNFIWGDKLPRQVRIQSIETGTWNEELEYKIQYITNKKTNWRDLGENYDTTENHKIDFTNEILGMEEDEYVTEFRMIFGNVKEGFQEIQGPKVTVKVNEDLANHKIFINNTYVTASYKETKLKTEDNVHTIVYTKVPNESIEKTPEKENEKVLPKTGIDD